jgi:hypothetical protein
MRVVWPIFAPVNLEQSVNGIGMRQQRVCLLLSDDAPLDIIFVDAVYGGPGRFRHRLRPKDIRQFVAARVAQIALFRMGVETGVVLPRRS